MRKLEISEMENVTASSGWDFCMGFAAVAGLVSAGTFFFVVGVACAIGSYSSNG